jgi:glycosyltransferase involved in cell wall biosynthesis
MPFYSIIIPTFNAAKTLSNAIESILQQRFQDFEILLIDGQSTDETVKIAIDFNDTRIKILSEKDSGIYDAMNKGIKFSNGDWIYFLGSDDKLLNSEVLYTINKFLLEDESDVIYGNVISQMFGGRYDGEFNLEKILNRNICHQAIFFKRSLFKKTKCFNTRYKILADWDHNLKWFLKNRIKKKYIDIDIAEFSDGGFSSVNNDVLFVNEKELNFINYGMFSIPSKMLYIMTSKEVLKAIRERNYLRLIKLKLVYYYSKICLKFQS